MYVRTCRAGSSGSATRPESLTVAAAMDRAPAGPYQASPARHSPLSASVPVSAGVRVVRRIMIPRPRPRSGPGRRPCGRTWAHARAPARPARTRGGGPSTARRARTSRRCARSPASISRLGDAAMPPLRMGSHRLDVARGHRHAVGLHQPGHDARVADHPAPDLGQPVHAAHGVGDVVGRELARRPAGVDQVEQLGEIRRGEVGVRTQRTVTGSGLVGGIDGSGGGRQPR